MKPILVFQSDFTYKEAAVSAMIGVVKSIDPTLDIAHATHEIPNYDIWSASFRLYQPLIYWPKGTIFVSVVDPGVGTKRRAAVAYTTNGYIIITPDNGTLTHVLNAYGIDRVYEIDVEHQQLLKEEQRIRVFHGRDVFAYNAARLAAGIVTIDEIAAEYSVNEIVVFDQVQPIINEGGVSGIIEIVDPNFGNAWSNISVGTLHQAGIEFHMRVHVEVSNLNELLFSDTIMFSETFGGVSVGECVLYQNEHGNASLALNQGNFIKAYNIHFGVEFRIKLSKETIDE